jgi:hypothetical protein
MMTSVSCKGDYDVVWSIQTVTTHPLTHGVSLRRSFFVGLTSRDPKGREGVIANVSHPTKNLRTFQMAEL